jgi:hypothetical protein
VVRRSSLLPAAVLCALTLTLGACGGDDSSPSDDAAAADDGATDRDATDGAPTDDGASDDGSNGSPTGDVDCASLKTAAEEVGVVIQILPQIQTPEQITDEFLLDDLAASRAAVDTLRSIAGADSTSLLDDVAAGLDAVESGRAGDPDAAVAEIARITGGLEGVQDWILRQMDLGTDLEATGCEL